MALEEMSGNWGKVITVGPSNGIVESVLANMMGFGGSVMMIGPSSGSGVSYATEVKSEDEMLDHVNFLGHLMRWTIPWMMILSSCQSS